MPASQTVICPTCRRIVLWQGNPHRPFCSDRCRLVDLGNWAAERYRIPAGPADARPPEDDEADEK